MAQKTISTSMTMSKGNPSMPKMPKMQSHMQRMMSEGALRKARRPSSRRRAASRRRY